MTKPENISQPDYKIIYQKLTEITYPCIIVVYGPERTYHTTYRNEHGGVFQIAECQNINEAWQTVDCGYDGYPPDIQIYYIIDNILNQL